MLFLRISYAILVFAAFAALASIECFKLQNRNEISITPSAANQEQESLIEHRVSSATILVKLQDTTEWSIILGNDVYYFFDISLVADSKKPWVFCGSTPGEFSIEDKFDFRVKIDVVTASSFNNMIDIALANELRITDLELTFSRFGATEISDDIFIYQRNASKMDFSFLEKLSDLKWLTRLSILDCQLDGKELGRYISVLGLRSLLISNCTNFKIEGYEFFANKRLSELFIILSPIDSQIIEAISEIKGLRSLAIILPRDPKNHDIKTSYIVDEFSYFINANSLQALARLNNISRLALTNIENITNDLVDIVFCQPSLTHLYIRYAIFDNGSYWRLTSLRNVVSFYMHDSNVPAEDTHKIRRLITHSVE